MKNRNIYYICNYGNCSAEMPAKEMYYLRTPHEDIKRFCSRSHLIAWVEGHG